MQGHCRQCSLLYRVITYTAIHNLTTKRTEKSTGNVCNTLYMKLKCISAIAMALPTVCSVLNFTTNVFPGKECICYTDFLIAQNVRSIFVSNVNQPQSKGEASATFLTFVKLNRSKITHRAVAKYILYLLLLFEGSQVDWTLNHMKSLHTFE